MTTHGLMIELLPDEYWWGGRAADGRSMHFGTSSLAWTWLQISMAIRPARYLFRAKAEIFGVRTLFLSIRTK